jgi:hypothetical protein
MGRTCPALVRQVRLDQTCSVDIGQVGQTSWVRYVMPWSDLSDNLFLNQITKLFSRVLKGIKLPGFVWALGIL